MSSFMFVCLVLCFIVSEELNTQKDNNVLLWYRIAGLSFSHYCAETKNIGSDSCSASLD